MHRYNPVGQLDLELPQPHPLQASKTDNKFPCIRVLHIISGTGLRGFLVLFVDRLRRKYILLKVFKKSTAAITESLRIIMDWARICTLLISMRSNASGVL